MRELCFSRRPQQTFGLGVMWWLVRAVDKGIGITPWIKNFPWAEIGVRTLQADKLCRRRWKGGVFRVLWGREKEEMGHS